MIEVLKNIPSRTEKPREKGLTMVMDKGLSLREAEDFLSTNSSLTDILKLGFGTSLLTNNVKEKIKLYQSENLLVYAGGTLFEAFIVRDQFDDYCKTLDKLGISMIEVSDGSMDLNHDLKCEYIHKLSKNYKVVSEVGSKNENVEVKKNDWIKWMKSELQAGSWKVIAEGREGGNVGVFNQDGVIKLDLIFDIIQEIPIQDIIWESPKKIQQVWFINKFGANVNLGNISPNEVIPLEALRLGLRGDTFENYL